MERYLISLRTREASAQLKAQGVELGTHVKHSDDKLQRILAARAAGESFQRIADALNADGVHTSNGGRWYSTTVKRAAESQRAARLS